MGMWQLKWELEDLSLRYLRQDIYLGIAKQLKRRRQEREAQVKELVGYTRRLEQAGIKAQIKVERRTFSASGARSSKTFRWKMCTMCERCGLSSMIWRIVMCARHHSQYVGACAKRVR